MDSSPPARPPAARRVETERPPPLCRGWGRSARANPHFFCASCHARERRRAKPRGGKTPQRPRRGPAACARVRGGEGSPDDPGARAPARSRPLPLTCRGRPEDSYHRHLLDRVLGEGGLADIQPRQRAGHVVVGSHYPHRKHVRRRRHRLPSTQRPGSSGGGGLRTGASSPSSSVRLPPPPRPPPLARTPRRAAARRGCGDCGLPPPPQALPARGSRRETLARSSGRVVPLLLPPRPPPPGITRAPRSQAAALVAMMMMSRTQPLGEGRRECVRARARTRAATVGGGGERAGGCAPRGLEWGATDWGWGRGVLPQPGGAAREEAGGKPGRAARAEESMIRPVGRVTAAGPGERR